MKKLPKLKKAAKKPTEAVKLDARLSAIEARLEVLDSRVVGQTALLIVVRELQEDLLNLLQELKAKPAPAETPHWEVESTMIGSFGYNEAEQRLEVLFRNGALYYYDGVPKHVIEGLRSAASVGGYFSEHVKGRFPFRVANKPAAKAESRPNIG